MNCFDPRTRLPSWPSIAHAVRAISTEKRDRVASRNYLPHLGTPPSWRSPQKGRVAIGEHLASAQDRGAKSGPSTDPRLDPESGIPLIRGADGVTGSLLDVVEEPSGATGTLLNDVEEPAGATRTRLSDVTELSGPTWTPLNDVEEPSGPLRLGAPRVSRPGVEAGAPLRPVPGHLFLVCPSIYVNRITALSLKERSLAHKCRASRKSRLARPLAQEGQLLHPDTPLSYRTTSRPPSNSGVDELPRLCETLHT